MPPATSGGIAGLLQDAGATTASTKKGSPISGAPSAAKGMSGLLADAQTGVPTPAPTPPKSGGFMAPLFGAAKKVVDFTKSNFSDVGKAVKTPTESKGFFQSMGEQFNSSVDQFNQNVDEWGKGGTLHKVDALGKTMLLPVNLLFAPLTAGLQGVQSKSNPIGDMPVIPGGILSTRQFADGLNRLFSAIGAGGGDAATVAVKALPISQESKDTILPLAQQLGALAAQLATGKAAGFATDVLKGGEGEVAPIPTEAPPEIRTKVVDTAKALGQEITSAMNDPKTHEVMAKMHEGLSAPVKSAPDSIFPKSGALAEVKGKLNSTKANDMHPVLRSELRDALTTHGEAATHAALKSELGAGDRQAASHIREAPTPQTAAEEQAAHESALRTAVQSSGKESTIPFGPKGKSDLPTIQMGGKKTDPNNLGGGVRLEPEKPPKPVANTPAASIKTEEVAKPAPKTVVEPKTNTPAVSISTEPAPKALEAKSGESLVGKSIEAKAIESNLTKGYGNETAKYDATTFKEQSRIGKELSDSGTDNLRSVIRGDKPMPEGLKPFGLIAAAEEHAKMHPEDAGQILSELANSKAATQTSEAASGLSLGRMREPDSATAKLQQIKKSLVEAAGGSEKIAKAKATFVKSARAARDAVNLTKEDLSWNKFLDQITC